MADLEKYRSLIEELIICRAKNKYANSTLEKTLFLTVSATIIC